MAALSPRMLADQARVEQIMLLGRASGLLREYTTWTDHSDLPWAGRLLGSYWFAICGLGPGWTFDPRGMSERAEDLARLRTEIMVPLVEMQHRLDELIKGLRFGSLAERLYWAIHRRLLESKRSVFRIPDSELRQYLWGGAVDAHPRHWRRSIGRGMESLSWIHLASGDESDDPPDLGPMTALITHFADLRSSPNDQCDEDCPARGGRPHSHFLINVGRGFLGCLEQCGEVDEENGVRYYEFPARGSRSTGATLRQLGRSGSLMSIYLPARLGEPARCKTLTPDQHRLLQAMFREVTRRRRNQRREFSEPDVLASNSVPDAQGGNEIECPLLTVGCRRIGFNGNAKRRGCGYCLTTAGGWLDKAGYDRDDNVGFFSDLAILARRLDLTVVGLLPGTNPPEWLNLDRMRHLSRQQHGASLLRRVHLRIYAPADCLDRWNQLFGWPPPSLLSTTRAEDQCAEISNLLERAGVKRAELASGIGMDASLLSKYLNGKRKCPENLVERVRRWLESWDGVETTSHADSAATVIASTSPATTPRTHLEVAMAYRDRGWSVIPQVPGTKQPHVKWKPLQERLPTEAELSDWWGLWPDAGIALIAGPLSGVLVVDVDGVEAHEVLLSRLGAEPMAPKVLSGSREPCRYHLFFGHPDLTTGAKRTPWHPKLEFRGHAGLAVLPPSLHRSGNLYEWAAGQSLEDIPLPGLPAEMLEALQPPPRVTPATTASPAQEVPDLDVSPSTRDFLSGVYANANGWNDRLFRAACDLEARGVPLEEAEPILLAGAQPWDSDEQDAARRTISSAYSQSREPAYT